MILFLFIISKSQISVLYRFYLLQPRVISVRSRLKRLHYNTIPAERQRQTDPVLEGEECKLFEDSDAS